MKVILLDIDGVLVTTPSWKKVEILNDGFMQFNKSATENLLKLIKETSAKIILITSHRSSYSISKWKSILNNRGININRLDTIDNYGISYTSRKDEIYEWATIYGKNNVYVIIDDDNSLNDLPPFIKDRWVKTKSMIGLDKEATEKALEILNSY